MEQGEQGSTKNREAENEAGLDGRARDPEGERAADPPPAAAAEKAAPERVDWTAILEERALVPDSEEASPVAVAEVPLELPRRRGLLHLVVAVVALFSVVASAAVVIALVRGSKSDEPVPAERSAQPSTSEAAAAAAAEAPPVTTPPVPVPPTTSPPESSKPPERPAAAAGSDDEPKEDPAETREGKKPRSGSKSEPRSKKPREEKAEPREEKKPRDEKSRDEKKPRDEKDGPGEESKPAADPNSPVEPSAKDVASAVEKVKSRIETCAKENGVSGMVAVRMQIEPSGSIGWSAIREGGDTFQSCVGRVLRDVRVPASQRGGILVHNITLPAP